MRAISHTLYQDVLTAGSFEELSKHIRAVVQRLGFDGFLYLTVLGKPEPGTDPETFILSDYDPAFVRHYQEHRCYRFDPAAIHIRQHQYPTPWGRHSFSGTRAEAMYGMAARYGVRSGATFRSRRPASPWPASAMPVTGTTSSPCPISWPPCPMGSCWPPMCTSADAAVELYPAPQVHTITERERACLSLAAQGLRDGEIAAQLDITRARCCSTWAMRRKLEADNRAQMIARAMALKIIGL
jgi:DNA-binding CsgD family transcriptional regulator